MAIDSAHDAALSALARHYRALDRWEDVASLAEKQIKVATDPARQLEIYPGPRPGADGADRQPRAGHQGLRERARPRPGARGRARGVGPHPGDAPATRTPRWPPSKPWPRRPAARRRAPSSTCARPRSSRAAAIATAPSSATSSPSTPTRGTPAPPRRCGPRTSGAATSTPPFSSSNARSARPTAIAPRPSWPARCRSCSAIGSKTRSAPKRPPSAPSPSTRPTCRA